MNQLFHIFLLLWFVVEDLRLLLWGLEEDFFVCDLLPACDELDNPWLDLELELLVDLVLPLLFIDKNPD